MVGVVIFLTLLFTIGFCIGYFGHAPQREEDLDRQILRQIYANQKLHLFGKDELQMKLFAEEIIELIGKYWWNSYGLDFQIQLVTFSGEKNPNIVKEQYYVKSIVDMTKRFLETSSKLKQDLWPFTFTE